MALKDHSLAATPAPPKARAIDPLLVELERLSETDLQELRHEIDLRLQLDLGQLNLADELALQYRQARALMHEIQGDRDVPANQMSQIFNSIRATLSDIVKQQQIVYSAERQKTFEVAFVKAAGLLSDEARAAFFDLYGKYLKDAHVEAAAQAGV